MIQPLLRCGSSRAYSAGRPRRLRLGVEAPDGKTKKQTEGPQ